MPFGEAQARVRIDLTNANADPLPTAITQFVGESTQEDAIGQQIRDVISNDLHGTGLFNVVPQAAHLQSAHNARVQGPNFGEWRLINVDAFMLGNIQLEQSGTSRKIKLEFRLYDTYSQKQLIGKRYTVDAQFWRHIAHRVADDIYSHLTGEDGYFTTRIVHIGEEPPLAGTQKQQRHAPVPDPLSKSQSGGADGLKTTKKLCVMDQDGGNYQCLTDGSHLVLTPRFNPQMQKIIYMSYANGMPRLYLLDLPTGRQEIIGDFEGLNSSPRFSPDGKTVAMTLTKGHEGNPEIYTMSLASRELKRLTFHHGIDTSPSYSPDGKWLVFNSNRGGKPNLYIMDSTGNKVRRLTYGGGSYFAPVWSPRGDLIAFVKNIDGKFSIGVIDPEGYEERQLTESFMDESPTWAPNGRVIVFSRQLGDDNRLFTIDLTGYNLKKLPTPNPASDPAWGPLIK